MLKWVNSKRIRGHWLAWGLGLGLGLTLMLAWVGSAGWATGTKAPPSTTQLQQWQETIKQYQVGVSQKKEELERIETAARQRLQALQTSIQLTDDQIATAEANIATAVAQLEDLEAQQKQAAAKYQAQFDLTAVRLRFLQQQRSQNTWAFLLDSGSLNQFLTRRQRLKQLYQADQRQLITLKAEQDKIQRQQQLITAKQQQIAYLKRQLEVQKNTLTTQAKSQDQMVNKLSQDRQILENAEAQLDQDAETLTLLIQQRLGYVTPQPGPITGTGRLSYPIRAPITSTFGWRIHPILGTQRFHNGLDFGAPTGTPIQAAERGRVIYAGWYGGYGNAVIVDHGNGATTLYAHASRLVVAEGDVVQRGQVLALVGSTGLSTGPHLHFEVRINGEPQDPSYYL
ncbi:peptidoglycan DD-metalloendopeptidase family protein [Thermosynechococcaceae cyanobacterium BACA0444]|uniref:Peptidoglycan DD-metalloendopeptidase family protein n=1 Tax=Pseudocalidococcus azoricus BACA0444 TaxID=2918990 RepID=A0AAE4JWS5_9CYAN|nr:peptidoglycan DD-metalloendopeptidase family protein [Pseudocalidococcus azoricus]MDS3859229.1 peptidoglycan DD-metalloendopeptidase family protein [Pseudocalidococcus azoricus BACA0444]